MNLNNNIDLSSSGINLGIIGTNFISDSLCDAAKKTGLQVTAVFSRAMDTGRAFAEKHGIENVYCDFEKFCSSDKINAAYIASPNFCHFQQSMALLDCGKHVLCEKPAASSLAKFESMVKKAGKNKLVLIEAMRPAYDPAIETIKSFIPLCGKLRFAHIEYSQYSSRYDKFKSGILMRAFDQSFSNAAVMDIGVYPIHICAALFGKPKNILSHSVKLDGGFEGQGNVILDYGDMTAEIAYSKITEAHTPSFIRGEDAEITFGHALSKIDSIEFFPRNGNPKTSEFIPAENNMIFELSAFADFINGRKSPEKYINDTKITLEIMDEIRRQNNIIFPEDNEF